MEIIPYGAAKIVTGSCYGIRTSKDKILVDCGMFQGDKKTEQLNYLPFEFNPKIYSALILTHAHLDHCGRIPLLVKQGFKGIIIRRLGRTMSSEVHGYGHISVGKLKNLLPPDPG